MVDRNSAIAATPSIDTVMKATAPAIRSVSWSRLSGAPDSDVTAPPAACPAVGASRMRTLRSRCRKPGHARAARCLATAAAWNGPSRKTPVA